MPDGSRRMLQGKFEAKKHAVRQTQDGWVVSFVVHPNDMTPEFSVAPLGTRLMLAYAEYQDEPDETTPAESDVQSAPARSTKSDLDRSRRSSEAYASKGDWGKAEARAGMLCKDRGFQEWMREKTGHVHVAGFDGESKAAARLRYQLNIDSRSEIGRDEGAFKRFLALETDYRFATGQLPEPR